MGTRPVAETVAAIEAESQEAERQLRRRGDSLTYALNWFANRHELGEKTTSDVLALAKRYGDFLELGAGNPFESDPDPDERLAKAKELLGGWLAYIKSEVVTRETYVALLGDTVLWLDDE